MRLRYDPEWISQADPFLEPLKEVIPAHDVQRRRAVIAKLYEGRTFAVPEDLELTTHHARSADGHEVAVYQVSKKANAASTTPGPAVVHIHGGGYIAVNAKQALPQIIPFASQSGVPFFSVDYRLAPESTFPKPLEDCYAGLIYVQSNATRLNIDPGRIALLGESAGGGLAAATAILARDRQLSPPLAKQILIYPMLDDRTTVDNTHGLSVFSINDILTGWAAYLGKKYGTDDVSPHAAPARVTDFRGLPPLYLDVGQLDHFASENLKYVSKFAAADIETEFHLYPGVIHAFQRWGQQSYVTRQALANRLRAIETI